MSDPELQLEKQRAELLKRIGSVGDSAARFDHRNFRQMRQTDMPLCQTRKLSAMGPAIRLTRKVQGKTVTETFRLHRRPCERHSVR